VPVSEVLTGLTPGTQYHFRIVATSLLGTQSSFDGAFTTLSAQPPAATTGSAGPVGATWATVAASVDPNGTETTYRIEYGATTA
jgi:hypothetical protein